MSKLRLFSRQEKKTAEEVPVIRTAPQMQHHILLEAVPVPVGTNEYDPEKVLTQAQSLRQLRI